MDDQNPKISLKQFRKIKKDEENKMKMKAISETQCLFKEKDFCHLEHVEVPKDVFGIMIAANMSKDFNPIMLNYCLKICF